MDCKNPRCVQVCPVGASFITKEGVVLIDKKHCVGCSYCVQACPYGMRYIHPVTRVADKCTWCYHRITRGKTPACVLACPRKARKFGEINDPQSEVYNIVRKHRASELKPEMKTHPQVYYLLVQVAAMRWNVVIGGQLFSKSLRGFTDYHLEFLGREGLLAVIIIFCLPFVAITVFSKILPPFEKAEDAID